MQEKPIPVFIINFNLVEWPRAMVPYIRRIGGEPIIVDNGSTYQPTLDWYALEECKILCLGKNYGHRAVWESTVLDFWKPESFYAVTDPDLDISQLPTDTLEHLTNLLRRYPWATKAGTSIEFRDYPKESPVAAQAYGWESRFWRHRLDSQCFQAPVDTTLAVYRADGPRQWRTRDDFARAVRADRPYTVRHLPFYATEDNMNLDFAHYLLSANDPLATMPKYLSGLARTVLQARGVTIG